MKFYTSEGISKILELLKTYLTNKFNIVNQDIDGKVDKNGSDRLMTANEGNKLSEIENNAQVNTIESISLNGVNISPDINKNVALTVITNAVDNLINYYKKNETYTKDEIDTLIGAITTLNIRAVNELPTEDISTITIYLVPAEDPGTQNIKDEYINLTGTTEGWEKIGSTAIDLSDYYTKDEVDTLIGQIDLSAFYTKTETDNLLLSKADLVNGKVPLSELPDIDEKQEVFVFESENNFPIQGKIDTLYISQASGKSYIWEVISNDYTFSGSYCTIDNTGKSETPITMEATITNWSYPVAPSGTWIGFQNNSYPSTEPPYTGVAFDAIMTKIDKTAPIAGDKITFYKYDGITSIIYSSEGVDYDISDCYYTASGTPYDHDLYIVANTIQQFSGIIAGPGSASYRGYQNNIGYKIISGEIVQPDWDQNDSHAKDYIKNKPYLGTAASKDVIDVIDDSTNLVQSDAIKTETDAIKKSISNLSTSTTEALSLKADKTELESKADKAELDSKADKTELDSKADLVDNKIKDDQIPNSAKTVLKYEDLAHFPTIGKIGYIYIALSTGETYIYKEDVGYEIFNLDYITSFNTLHIDNTGKTRSPITIEFVFKTPGSTSEGVIGDNDTVFIWNHDIPGQSGSNLYYFSVKLKLCMEKIGKEKPNINDKIIFYKYNNELICNYYSLENNEYKEYDVISCMDRNPADKELFIEADSINYFAATRTTTLSQDYGWEMEVRRRITEDTSQYKKIGVQADWAQTDPTADDYIKNKPASGNGLPIVTEMPENPTDGQLVVWGGSADYTEGHTYKYDENKEEWVDIIENYIYDADWVSQGDISFNGRQAFHGHVMFYDGSDSGSGQTPEFNGSVFFGQNQNEDGTITFEPPVNFYDSIHFNSNPYGGGVDYYIDKNGDAFLHDISTGNILADGITMVEYNGDINMNGNDLNAVGEINIGGQVLPINGAISVGGNADFNSYNIENINSTDTIELHVSDISGRDGNITVNDTIEINNESSGTSAYYKYNGINGDSFNIQVDHLYYNNKEIATKSDLQNLATKSDLQNLYTSNIYGIEDEDIIINNNIDLDGNDILNADIVNSNIIQANSTKSPKMGYAEYFKALKASNVVPYRFVKINETNSNYIELSQADGSNPYIGISATNAMIVGNNNQTVTSSEENILVGLTGSFWIDIYEDENIVPGNFVAPEDGGYASKTTQQFYPQVIKVDSVNNRCLVLLK